MPSEEGWDGAPRLVILFSSGRGERLSFCAALGLCGHDGLRAPFADRCLLFDRYRDRLLLDGSRRGPAHEVGEDLAADLLLLTAWHGEQGALDTALLALAVALGEAGGDDDDTDLALLELLVPHDTEDDLRVLVDGVRDHLRGLLHLEDSEIVGAC